MDIICVSLKVFAQVSQTKHVIRDKSIYGLSVDLLLYEALETTLMSFASLSYQMHGLPKRQYSKRFPLYPVIPISRALSTLYIISFTACGLRIFQYLKFRTSRHKLQLLSYLTAALVLLTILIGLFILYNSLAYYPAQMGRYGLFYLDFIDYCWFVGSLSGAVKLIPQISMNWAGITTGEVAIGSIIAEMISSIILISLFLNSKDSHFHHETANRDYVFSAILRLLSTGVILYQCKVYSQVSPYLVPLNQKVKDIERNE